VEREEQFKPKSNEKSMVQEPSTNPDSVPPLAGAVFKGAIFTVILRIVVRLLGLISISVTARLLTPEDFGIAGTANLILGLFLVMRETGMGEAIIRERTLDISFIRTTWTLRVITGAVITVLLLAVAAPAATLLNEPKAEDIIRVLAIIPLIESLASPASAVFMRNFEFGKEFLIKSLHKLFLVMTTIGFAIWLGDYWALIYSQLLAAIYLVIISQLFFPMTPIPSLRGGKVLGIFAFWSLWRSIAIYLVERGDEFVVRRLVSSSFFGLYHAGRDITRILIFELIQSSTMGFFPAISRLRDDKQRLASAIETMFAVAAIVGAALSGGLLLVAGEVVLIVLGDQWVDATPIIAGLSIGLGAQAVSFLCLRVLTTFDRQDLGAIMYTIRAIVVIVGCAFSAILIGIDAVPISFSVISAVLAIGEIAFTYRLGGIPMTRAARICFRPIAAAAAMILAVSAMPLDDLPVLWAILAKTMGGASVYISVLIVLWQLAGRPAGGEKALVDRLPSSRVLAGQARQVMARIRRGGSRHNRRTDDGPQ
jgi:O-antigen/teichoic acid export membrane protein